MTVGLYVYNLTNHANYTGYSGVLISPFYSVPQSVAGHAPRRSSARLQFLN
jgi:hypothetical protein